VRLVAAREAGVLKRWRATPLPRWCYFLGRILATVVVARARRSRHRRRRGALYNTHLTVSGALGALVAFVLGAFAWAATATALTAVIPTVEAAAPTS
jgi:ABC-2 type transport system permease protein